MRLAPQLLNSSGRKSKNKLTPMNLKRISGWHRLVQRPNGYKMLSKSSKAKK
jgi:hypothetical protein